MRKFVFIEKARTPSVPSTGQLAGSSARLKERETSKSRPHFGQWKSYRGIAYI